MSSRDHAERDVVVVGGGIAGIAAATALSERGLRVSLVEAEHYLGGRAGAWAETLASGETIEMERGFHAFFRQYYSLRKLLRRVDPRLEMLCAIDDYPVYGSDGARESFARLPGMAPFNIIALTCRTKTLSLGDLLKVDARTAMRMLAFDGEATYRDYDHISASAYLDALHFPPAARRMLFDVFAHSFFNPESTMSAGELLMMFHFYFMGNREGLLFDVVRRPMSQAFWTPFARYLRGHGVHIRLGEHATRVRRQDGDWLIDCDRGPVRANNLILAVTVPALKQILSESPDLYRKMWSERISALEVTKPFVVWRMWLDRPTDPGRPAFAGTAGPGLLENISLYHLFQDQSRNWAHRTGGAVVELHAYAVDPSKSEAEIRRELLAALHGIYPETLSASIVDERYLLRDDCPDFSCGSHALHPGVGTPHPRLFLAGDFVRLPLPSALMERAACSGFLAANRILASRGLATEAVESITPRGILASLMKVVPMLRPRIEH